MKFHSNYIINNNNTLKVSNEHRERVSQRSYEDEQRRRAESTKNPLEIVDYSKNFKKVNIIFRLF